MIEFYYKKEDKYIKPIKVILPNDKEINRFDEPDERGAIIDYEPLKDYIDNKIKIFMNGELEEEGILTGVYKDSNDIYNFEYKVKKESD